MPENDRQRAWERLQTEAPEMVTDLRLLTRVFGRPKALRLRLHDEIIYDTLEDAALEHSKPWRRYWR